MRNKLFLSFLKKKGQNCGGCRKAAYERTSRLQGADVTCFKDCVSLD